MSKRFEARLLSELTFFFLPFLSKNAHERNHRFVLSPIVRLRSELTLFVFSSTGMTILTLESELTRQQRENLMIVSTLASSLLTIIDDILDISKSQFILSSVHLPTHT